ncbi:hypothetical protein AVEN_158134-1 [Araneus ventricosus]|uniref:Uncharacterized protein n=1 Tax=Araneus ventricosus TaxID=182803 RepID=A0A4Y2Q096_ARAVE|nr:hypothetical protein AVEN_158134-1 [Araneus ventricosus]
MIGVSYKPPVRSCCLEIQPPSVQMRVHPPTWSSIRAHHRTEEWACGDSLLVDRRRARVVKQEEGSATTLSLFEAASRRMRKIKLFIACFRLF